MRAPDIVLPASNYGDHLRICEDHAIHINHKWEERAHSRESEQLIGKS